MGHIILRNINFAQAVGSPQSLTVRYKRQSLGDETYITAASDVAASPSGALATPLVINDLEDLTPYVLSIHNNCGGNPYLLTVTTSL